MSLQTDIVFVKALRSDADLMQMLPAGDVYNTAIALPEEEADNAPLPYVIVTYDGMQNDDSTKDNAYRGLTDRVQIGVEVAAKTRPQLAEIATKVRNTIDEYFMQHYGDDTDPEYKLIPYSMTFSTQPVQYDSLKPCYWQQLNWQCETNPD